MSIVSDEQHVDGLLSFWMILVSGRDGLDSTHELDPIDEERERIWLLNKSPMRDELIKNNTDNNDNNDQRTNRRIHPSLLRSSAKGFERQSAFH